jgi:hypothetical protein
VGITYPSPLSAGFHHLPVGLGKHSLFSGFGSVPDGDHLIRPLEVEKILVIGTKKGVFPPRIEDRNTPLQKISTKRRVIPAFLCVAVF